jgi:hypothetical protein
LALVELYTRTNGMAWITRTNWLQFGANAPCGWYGVVCGNGHVRQLLLAGNNLSGTLPLALGDLTELRRLRLENNALRDRIPPSLCDLAHLENLSIAFNALTSRRQSVLTCLAALESDWQASQTAPVTKLRLTEITTDSVSLTWTPISYTEEGGHYEISIATNVNGPYNLHGTTANKLAASYVVTGLNPGTTYFWRVHSYTPPHGDQPSHVRSVSMQTLGATRAITGRVLVAAYFPADNDLSPEIPYVIDRMRRGTAHNPNVKVYLLVDGAQNGDSRLLEIANGDVTPTDAVMERWGVEELDTSDPAVLAWFLRYARTEFPAERTVAAIIGHGVPLAPEIEWPAEVPVAQLTTAAMDNSPANAIPPLPKEHDYTPSDVTNRGYMSAVDMGVALMEATDNGANPFDVIFFDQCFQGSLEMLYEVRNSARVYVASPNYAWLVAAYDRYLPRFTPTASPMQMAQGIIAPYEASLNPRHPNAIFWVRNDDLLAIAAKVNELADALLAALQAGEQSKIGMAAQQAKYVDTTQCGRENLQLGPPDELVGIESLGARLQEQFGVGDPYGIDTILGELQTLLGEISKFSIMGNPYLAPNVTWDFGNSLTILAPLQRNVPANVAWRASIYRAETPFTATWSLFPSEHVTVTASMAFVREGRWDEFLAEWYLNLSPTVGQWCQYMPSAQVVITDSETLTLTASNITTDSLALGWTPTDDTSATEYWLYAQDPYAINLQFALALPLTQTGVSFTGLDGGPYRYMVVARNEEEETIAQSGEVTVTLTGAPPPSIPLALHLPLVWRD